MAAAAVGRCRLGGVNPSQRWPKKKIEWARPVPKAPEEPNADSQDLATILDPFQVIFVDLGPDRLSET